MYRVKFCAVTYAKYYNNIEVTYVSKLFVLCQIRYINVFELKYFK